MHDIGIQQELAPAIRNGRPCHFICPDRMEILGKENYWQITVWKKGSSSIGLLSLLCSLLQSEGLCSSSGKVRAPQKGLNLFLLPLAVHTFLSVIFGLKKNIFFSSVLRKETFPCSDLQDQQNWLEMDLYG